MLSYSSQEFELQIYFLMPQHCVKITHLHSKKKYKENIKTEYIALKIALCLVRYFICLYIL